MKKFLSVFTLLLSMALGALYLYSLLRWTDASMGFATQGSTSLRYFAMLVHRKIQSVKWPADIIS